MKGLMFNLLATLARDAGCGARAWDLVAEFAAAEAVLEAFHESGPSGLPPRHLFDVPVEAMVRCLVQDAAPSDSWASDPPAAWDPFDLAACEEWSLEESVCELDDPLPQAWGGGLSRGAFAEPEPLESWPPEADADDAHALAPHSRPRKQ